MRRQIDRCRLSVMVALLLATMGVLAAARSVVAAQSRGDGPQARERTAVEMCARELKDREQGRDAKVSRTIRSEYRNDKVYWDGYMSVRRNGPDVTRRVECVVAFDGKNRITSFRTSSGGSGGGSGGGDDAASRACWREAERRGYDVRDVADSLAAGSRGRLVILRLDARRDLLCLYRGGATLYRPV